MKKLLTVIAIVIFTAAQAFSAPVDLPSSLTNVPDSEQDDRDTVLTEKPLRLSLGAEGDWLMERELENGQTIEGETYSGKLSMGLGTFDIYGSAGMTQDLEIGNGAASRANFEFDDALALGAGVSAAILQLPDYETFTIFADAKYRTVWEPEIESVTAGGTRYSVFNENDETSWQEWQGALGVGMKIDYVLPYVGVKYSEVEIDTDVTAGGTRYATDEAVNSDENIGVFGGVTIMPADAVSFDVQGRFIDEEAVSGKVTFKF